MEGLDGQRREVLRLLMDVRFLLRVPHAGVLVEAAVAQRYTFGHPRVALGHAFVARLNEALLSFDDSFAFMFRFRTVT